MCVMPVRGRSWENAWEAGREGAAVKRGGGIWTRQGRAGKSEQAGRKDYAWREDVRQDLSSMLLAQPIWSASKTLPCTRQGHSRPKKTVRVASHFLSSLNTLELKATAHRNAIVFPNASMRDSWQNIDK